MSDQPRGISRRHFFFGTLLAGVVPRAGFGSVPSLKQLGFQSPNEKAQHRRHRIRRPRHERARRL